MTDDLNNASFGLLARALPVLDGSFFPVDCRHPSNPKDTRAFVMLGRNVVKDNSSFPFHLLGIKRIFHQHEDIGIVRLALGRHKGSKNAHRANCPVLRTRV
jgi:hypothetical protein